MSWGVGGQYCSQCVEQSERHAAGIQYRAGALPTSTATPLPRATMTTTTMTTTMTTIATTIATRFHINHRGYSPGTRIVRTRKVSIKEAMTKVNPN